MDRNEILAAIRSCVAESLAIGEEEIKLDSRLIDDLGADSLDFLDIIFGLEKRFSIKLRDPNLDLLIRADFSGKKSTDSGYLSIEEVNLLGEWLPALQSAPNRDRITVRNLYSYITIETLIILLEKKLKEV